MALFHVYLGEPVSVIHEPISPPPSRTFTDQLFPSSSIQHIYFCYAILFQIFTYHLQPYHLWSTLTTRANESWIFHRPTFLYPLKF